MSPSCSSCSRDPVARRVAVAGVRVVRGVGSPRCPSASVGCVGSASARRRRRSRSVGLVGSRSCGLAHVLVVPRRVVGLVRRAWLPPDFLRCCSGLPLRLLARRRRRSLGAGLGGAVSPRGRAVAVAAGAALGARRAPAFASAPACRAPGCCGSRRTAGPSSTGSRWSSRRARRSGTRCRRPRRPPGARRAASSAAGRTGRSSRRPACSCSSAGAGWERGRGHRDHQDRRQDLHARSGRRCSGTSPRSGWRRRASRCRSCSACVGGHERRCAVPFFAAWSSSRNSARKIGICSRIGRHEANGLVPVSL